MKSFSQWFRNKGETKEEPPIKYKREIEERIRQERLGKTSALVKPDEYHKYSNKTADALSSDILKHSCPFCDASIEPGANRCSRCKTSFQSMDLNKPYTSKPIHKFSDEEFPDELSNRRYFNQIHDEPSTSPEDWDRHDFDPEDRLPSRK